MSTLAEYYFFADYICQKEKEKSCQNQVLFESSQ
jgi:hypothetical protein